jgi:hypothetical protein
MKKTSRYLSLSFITVTLCAQVAQADAHRKIFACDQDLLSTEVGSQTAVIDLGPNAGVSHLEFNAFAIPDAAVVKCNGQPVFSTHGPVSGSKDFYVRFAEAEAGASNFCTFTVKSNEDDGTQWSVFAGCPSSAKTSRRNIPSAPIAKSDGTYVRIPAARAQKVEARETNSSDYSDADTSTVTDDTPTPTPLNCGKLAVPTNDKSGISLFKVNLGSTAGKVSIDFDAFAIPDNVSVSCNGHFVISDAKLYGKSSIDFDYAPFTNETDSNNCEVSISSDQPNDDSFLMTVGCPK